MPPPSPLSLPTYNIEQPDLSKMNLAGYHEDPRISGAIENAMAKSNEFARALEKRYEQPNWFKVAAGFAKPQLGGFTASLGSAAEALGDTVEQQRMVAPTVAQMQMKTSIMEASLRQQELAERLLFNWEKDNPGKPYPPELISKVEKLTGSSSPQAKAAQTFQTAMGTKLEQDIKAQRAKQESPFYQLPVGALPDDWSKNTQKTRQQLQDELVQSGKFTPEGVKLFSDQKLLDENLALQQTNAAMKIKNAASAGDVIAGNSQALQDLATARDLVHSPNIDKLLGIGSGQTGGDKTNYLSVLFGWIAAPTEPGKIGALNEAAAKLQKSDPRAYDDFQVLQKVLSKNLADARATIQNPSVGAQNLLSATQPSVLNTKNAITRMLDLIAHEKSSQTREGILRQTYRGRDPAGFESDPNSGYGRLQAQIQDERRAIEKAPNLGAELPTYYNPYASLYSQTAASTNARPATPATSAAPAGGGTQYKPPKGWHKNPDGSFSKD
jgi:hypothetical protein